MSIKDTVNFASVFNPIEKGSNEILLKHSYVLSVKLNLVFAHKLDESKKNVS